jgi:hypothetical protein
MDRLLVSRLEYLDVSRTRRRHQQPQAFLK